MSVLWDVRLKRFHCILITLSEGRIHIPDVLLKNILKFKNSFIDGLVSQFAYYVYLTIGWDNTRAKC